ncbi:MAG: ATP-binding protein [Pseudomonadota bacterium]
MVYRRYSLFLALRLIVVAVAIGTSLWLLMQPGLHSATAIALGVTGLASAELWWFVGRTNREVARFLDAARYADYSQRFQLNDIGTGFGELSQTFTDILDRIFAQREDRETELRRLRALIDHIPVPLLTVRSERSITLQNNAARRLFGAAQVTRITDLSQFGAGFRKAVEEAVPGKRELVSFAVEGVDYRLALATTEIVVAGERQRLISLQDIQSELNTNQAEAWQDLVNVLTHEIMNSITPITSLASTANDLVSDVLARADSQTELHEDLVDLRDAVATVARRSDSLVQFVENYREVSRLAPAEKERVSVADLFDSVRPLALAEGGEDGPDITVSVEPPGLEVQADRVLLEPVLLNMLRNARQATAGVDQPAIRLSGSLNRRGNVAIEVSDNGPGVPEELAQKVFVPFFTTRSDGSGVGLALARQVMTAHGGFIQHSPAPEGGAVFTLTF